MNNIFKKSVAIFVSITTIAWLTGLTMLAPVMTATAATTISDGDLIQNPNAEGDAKFDIYIAKEVYGEKYKRLILNPEVFESYGHLSWDDVKEVSAATMAEYDTSNLVFPDADGDGKADGAVYYLTPDGDTGTRRHVNVSAERFAEVYSWHSVYVINSVDYENYTEGTSVNEVPVTDDDDDGDDEESVGSLDVSLSADTPASGIAVNGALRVPFTTFTVTAEDGDVTIDSMKVRRGGTSQDDAFDGVNIVDEDTNRVLSDSSKSLNSSHEANITNNVTVEEGETKKFTIVGDMASGSTYSGETPNLQLMEMTLNGEATLDANLPIVGNTMTVNGSISLGDVDLTAGTYTDSDTDVEVGQENLVPFSFKLTNNGDDESDVDFEYIKLYNNGSADLADDLSNIELYEATSGDKLADGEVDGNYIHFNMEDSPYTIDEGQSEQFKVELDVDGGSGRDIDLQVYRDNDVLFMGQSYGAYLPLNSSVTTPFDDDVFSIKAGNFTVRKSNNVGSENIAIDDEQELGAFEFDVEGEEMEVTDFDLRVASTAASTLSADALQSVKLIDPDGNVVSGPNDVTAWGSSNDTKVSWTDTFTLPVGESVYTVVGNIVSNKGWSTDDNITVKIDDPSNDITAEGVTTNESITSDTSSTVEANQQTVKGAYLSVSRNSTPGDKTVIAGSDDVSFGAWTLDATDAGEDVRINQLQFAGHGWAATNTDNMHVYMDGVELDDNNPSALSDATSITPSVGTTTFTFSDPIIVEKGTSQTVTLRGDKDTVSSDDDEQWGLTDSDSSSNESVVAYGDTSGSRATTDVTADDGATVTTASSGSLSVQLNGNPSKGILTSGASEQLVNKVNFAASDSEIDVDKLYITVDDEGDIDGTDSGDADDVSRVYLKSGGEYVGNTDGYAVNSSRTSISLDSGDLTIPSNGDVDVEIYVDMANVSSGSDGYSGTANAAFNVGIAGANSVEATDSASNDATLSSVNATSSAFVLHDAYPTVTLTDNTASTNVDGTYTLFELDVEANDGKVALYRMSFLTSTTTGDGISVSDGYLLLDSCSGCSVGASTVSAGDDVSGTMAVGTDANGDGGTQDYWSFVFDNQDTSSVDKEALEIPEGGKATIQFRASVSGLSASGDSIQTKLLGDGAATTTDETNGDKADEFTALNQGNFVWSDLYSDDIGANTTNTAQWYNGYLIEGVKRATSTKAWTLGYSS